MRDLHGECRLADAGRSGEKHRGPALTAQLRAESVPFTRAPGEVGEVRRQQPGPGGAAARPGRGGVLQQAAVGRLQCRAGLQPQLPGELLAALVVRGQRLRSAADPVQCGDLGGAQPFPQGVPAHHLVHGVGDRGGLAGLQLRLRPCLVHGQPAGVLPVHGGAQHIGMCREITERRMTPQVQGSAVVEGGAVRRTRAQLGIAVPGQFVEPQAVALVRREVQDVSAGAVAEPAEVAGVEYPAEVRDVHLEVLAGRARRIVRPEGVGEFLHRHRCVRTGEENRQDETLLERAERQGQAVAGGSQGAEKVDAERSGTGLAGVFSRNPGIRLSCADFGERVGHCPQPLPQPVSSEFGEERAIACTKASGVRSGGERIREEP